MTTISIAMATYNGERFIGRQLESISQQSVLPSELVVCDDGSTDSTLDIVNEFSRSVPFPVVIVKNPSRLGFTANFLQTARKCSGELIAFSDQDDEWLPMKLERVLKASRESDALLIAHSTEWIDKDGNALGIVYPCDRKFRKNLRTNDFDGHAIVIRRSLLDMTSHSLTPENYKETVGDLEFGHDVLLLEAATAVSNVYFIRDVLVRWRVHPDSETNDEWTDEFGAPARAKVSFADRMFPPDLAERYAAAGTFYRKHSMLLSSVVADMASFAGVAAAGPAKLTHSMKLMRKRADVMDLRAKLYRPLTRKQRIRVMLTGAAMGQYRNAKRGGVGIHNALRDIIACVFR